MTNSTKLSVILPVYNEQQNIESLLEEISIFSKNNNLVSTIIVINDGSTDNSKKIIQDFKCENELIYFEHQTNLGYSKSLCSGIKLASDEGHILIMDADKQFKFENVVDLLKHSDQYDIVSGHRLHRQDPLLRKLLGVAWSFIGRLIFNTGIADLNCGFKLFKAQLIKKIEIDSIGPGFNLEVFSDPIIKTCRLKVVHIPHYPREHGTQTGVSIKTLLCSIKDLWVVFRKRFF